MLFYAIWWILKIVIWILTLLYLFNYVNVYEDQKIWLIFWFIWLFLLAWWISFFVFFVTQKLFSNRPNVKIASKSYRLSLLFWMFIIINVLLILIEKWSKLTWLWIMIIFIILQLVTISDNEWNYENEQ